MIGFAVIFIVVMFWSVWIIPQLINPLEEFSHVVLERGFDQIASSYGEDLGTPFPYEEIVRQNVINEDENYVEIDLSFVGTNLATYETIFVFSETFYIDKFTRMYKDETKGYFTFPPNVKKQDYVGSIPFNSIPAKSFFQQTERISNLDTYLFSCESKNNDVTNSFPQFHPHTVWIDYKCMVNVEPKTGHIVKLELEWDSYFVENGTRTLQAEIGGIKITETSSNNLIENTKKQLQLLFIYEIIIPITLILIGLGVLFTIILFQKIQRQNKLILKTRDELVKKERLSSIGQLAARISHDMRNPVSVIKMDIELLKRQKKLDENQIIRFENSINRISYQINGILDNVRENPIKYSKFSINDIINETVTNIFIPPKVKINITGDKINLLGDKHQIEIMLTNLILNGIQEIENGGTLDITVSETDTENIIEIKDSGRGIDEDQINQIFEPLITSKEKGTGLGLTSVKSIVKRHGGTISVKNNPTTFTVKFPKNEQ